MRLKHNSEIMTSRPDPHRPSALQLPNVVDDHIRSQNGHKLGLQYQLYFLPMWSLKSRLLDLQRPILEVVSTYHASLSASMDKIKRAQGEVDPVSELQFVVDEMQDLHSAYETYCFQLKQIHAELQRHVRALANRCEEIWDYLLNVLLPLDEEECRVRAFCLKKVILEYEGMEGMIEESFKNCVQILNLSTKYLMSMTQLAF